jgi:uncharacterized protein YecE (DUF72 family)
MKFYIGTSGYGYKEWQGKFYPEKISPHDMLRFYAERLGAVEINNTFYHMPTANILANWTEQVPVDFIFAFKAPQVITHYKRLKNVGSEIQYLFRTLSVLHRKMGPVLFQFPHSFRADPEALENFITLIPGETPCAFEFRHPSWINDATLDLLRTKECILCITDTDEQPAQEIISTASWGYLRLRRSDYTDADLSLWLTKSHLQKWKTVFVFFKHEDRAQGPELAMRFRKLAEA